MFDVNRAKIIGRLSADATIYNLLDGGRVTNITIATDERYINKTTGEILLRAWLAKDPPGEAVAEFLPVELDEDAPALLAIVDVVEHMDRLDDTSKFGECTGEWRRAFLHLKHAHDRIGLDAPELERTGQAQEVVEDDGGDLAALAAAGAGAQHPAPAEAHRVRQGFAFGGDERSSGVSGQRAPVSQPDQPLDDLERAVAGDGSDAAGHREVLRPVDGPGLDRALDLVEALLDGLGF